VHVQKSTYLLPLAPDCTIALLGSAWAEVAELNEAMKELEEEMVQNKEREIASLREEFEVQCKEVGENAHDNMFLAIQFEQRPVDRTDTESKHNISLTNTTFMCTADCQFFDF
jgi:hypothetical protein